MQQKQPSAPKKERATSGVQSVERALKILEVLADDGEGYRLTDIASETDLSPSTVHRLLTTLERRQFAQFNSTTGLWHVGRQAFSVGSTFVRQHNFVAPALPFLRRLRDLTRETANLGVVDDGEVVVLAQVESREIMRAITRVGGRVPVVMSGMGKAILSTYGETDIPVLIPAHRTASSNKARAPLRQELQRIRRQGYAIDDEDFFTGIRCVAAPVYGPHGEAICSISVSGLTSRLPDDRLERLGELLRDTAQEMTIALGGRLPGQNRN